MGDITRWRCARRHTHQQKENLAQKMAIWKRERNKGAMKSDQPQEYGQHEFFETTKNTKTWYFLHLHVDEKFLTYFIEYSQSQRVRGWTRLFFWLLALVERYKGSMVLACLFTWVIRLPDPCSAPIWPALSAPMPAARFLAWPQTNLAEAVASCPAKPIPPWWQTVRWLLRPVQRHRQYPTRDLPLVCHQVSWRAKACHGGCDYSVHASPARGKLERHTTSTQPLEMSCNSWK